MNVDIGVGSERESCSVSGGSDARGREEGLNVYLSSLYSSVSWGSGEIVSSLFTSIKYASSSY